MRAVPQGRFPPFYLDIVITQNDDFLPTASTCSNTLHLPNYSSNENLKSKMNSLLEIIATGNIRFETH